MKEYDHEQMRKLQHLTVKVEVICEAGAFKRIYGFAEGAFKEGISRSQGVVDIAEAPRNHVDAPSKRGERWEDS